MGFRHVWLAAAGAGLLLLPCAEADSTLGDLSRIQDETLLLKAKAERAAAEADLEAKRRSAAGVGQDMEPPVVKVVYGVDHKLVATFLYSNGVVMDAGAGDTILGGFKVAAISVDKVQLVRGKTRYQVGFSATAPAVPVQTQTSIPMSGPGMLLPPSPTK